MLGKARSSVQSTNFITYITNVWTLSPTSYIRYIYDRARAGWEAIMAAARKSETFVPGGFGAGVGAAVAMMLVMAVLRLTTNTVSIPELMEESLIRLTGGQVEAFFINSLGVGGKALLLVTIVEGTLL